MKQLTFDVAVIGGGPAGLAAALAAKEQGATRVLIIERNLELGGILQQCIHHGFGLHRFKQELTGPEYAQRFIDMVCRTDIEVMLETMVLEITNQKQIYAINQTQGMMQIDAKAIILAMGCRERTRGALRIPGTRPAGVFTAGAAQRFVNIDGYIPGKRAVILGSGDIGLIMARRFTLEGAEVKAVVEILPYAAGLTRNVVQCLDDYGIPLILQSTITCIHGKERIEGVTIAQVDQDWNPIAGTERDISCDTLLLSVGLIPENELSSQVGIQLDPVTNGPAVDSNLMTSIPGIFACGNVLHVHDLVDFVSQEAETAGCAAAAWASEKQYSSTRIIASTGKPGPCCPTSDSIPFDGVANECCATWGSTQIIIKPGNNIRYVVPQRICPDKKTTLYLRVRKPDQDVSINVGELKRMKHTFIRPSEMIKINLTPELLARHQSDYLDIHVVKEMVHHD